MIQFLPDWGWDQARILPTGHE